MLEALVFGGVALGMLLCYVLGPSVCGDGEDITGTWASDSSPLLSLASQPALVPRLARSAVPHISGLSPSLSPPPPPLSLMPPFSRSTPPFTSHKKPNSSFYQYTAHPLAPTTHSQLPTPPSRQRRRAGCVDEPSSGRQAK